MGGCCQASKQAAEGFPFFPPSEQESERAAREQEGVSPGKINRGGVRDINKNQLCQLVVPLLHHFFPLYLHGMIQKYLEGFLKIYLFINY